jgi:hypothetical protein
MRALAYEEKKCIAGMRSEQVKHECLVFARGETAKWTLESHVHARQPKGAAAEIEDKLHADCIRCASSHACACSRRRGG